VVGMSCTGIKHKDSSP